MIMKVTTDFAELTAIVPNNNVADYTCSLACLLTNRIFIFFSIVLHCTYVWSRFEKTARKSLANMANPNTGPGSYNPVNNSKGVTPIGQYSYKSVDEILNNSMGFKPKGFGRVARFDEQKQTRFAVNDKYMKEMMRKSMKDAKLKQAEERKKMHGTFGTGAQFTLFNAASGKPGPGEYNPIKMPLKKTCNIKLGFKLTVAGGTGAEGANIASFQDQQALINRELIEKTGIEDVDKQMAKYRKTVDRKVAEAEKESNDCHSYSNDDGVPSEKELNRLLFFNDAVTMPSF